MIVIASVSTIALTSGVVLIALGAPKPDPDEPRHLAHASLGVGPTGATFLLEF